MGGGDSSAHNHLCRTFTSPQYALYTLILQRIHATAIRRDAPFEWTHLGDAAMRKLTLDSKAGESGRVRETASPKNFERGANPKRVARVLVFIGPSLEPTALPVDAPLHKVRLPRQLRQRVCRIARQERWLGRAGHAKLRVLRASWRGKVLTHQGERCQSGIHRAAM